MKTKTLKLRFQKFISVLTIFLILGQVTLPSVTALAVTLESSQEVVIFSDIKEEQTETTTSKTVTDSTVDGSEEARQPIESVEQETNQSNAPPTPFEVPTLKAIESDGVLSIGEDGNVYYDGELLYYPDGNVPANMEELFKKGVPTKLTARSARASVGTASIEYLGTVTWGYHTVGNFRVNGKQAFCIEHPKGTPATGAPNMGLDILNNSKIQSVLYWGWGGPKNVFSDSAAGIVATSLALSYFYYGDGPYNSLPSGYDTLISKANAGDVPSHKLQINNNNQLVNLPVTFNGTTQKSSTTKLNGDKTNSITFTVPADITFKNETTGETATNRSVTVYGEQSFHFEAAPDVTKTFSSGVLKGTVKAFQPLVVKPVSSGLQDIGTWRWYDDPEQVVSFSVAFTAREGQLDILKLDSATGKPLPGAKFKITYGSTVVEKTADANGKISLSKLPSGTKGTVQEISAPNGYVIAKDPQSFTVEAAKTITLTFNNAPQTGIARLFKEDSKTGANAYGSKYLLEGAVYGLYQADGTKIKDVTLKNLNGRVQAEIAGLSLGDYYWQEQTAPNGYLLDKSKLSFSLVYAGQDNNTTLTEKVAKDVAQLGKATLIKQDTETGDTAQGEATLENAVYGLFQADGTKIKSVTLKNVNGKVQADVSDLKLGDYYWQEEKAPTGYQLNTKKLAFSLNYVGETITVSTNTTIATDDVMKGQFDLFKFGNYSWLTEAYNWLSGKDTSTEQKEGLADAEFTVYQNYGAKKEVARKTTTQTGYLAFGNLPYGTYRVSETKTPKGYKQVADFLVTISAHGQSFHYSIENKVKEAQLKIVKVDSESGKAIPRPEAGFEIYSVTTGQQLKMKDLTGKEQSVFLTNTKGELQIPTMLAYGDYRIKEVQAPKGYVLAKEEVTFSVTGDEKDGIVIIKFKNDNQKGQIKLHKNVQTATSLVTETTEYGDLTKIEYTQQSGEGFKFKIKIKKDIITPEGTEKQKAGLFVQAGGTDLVLITDKDGNVESLPILYIGSYELVEVEAPKGVVMLKEPQPFEIKYAGQSVDVTSMTVTVDNEIQTIDIIGYKSQEVITGWENGQAVIDLEQANNGQVFALRNAEDQTIGQETLAANTTLSYAKVVEGELTFKDYHLPEGKYYLEEINAGDQHVLNPEKYYFEYVAVDNLDSQTIHVWADSTAVNKQGMTRIARTPIINKLARAAVQLVKTDALDGKALENVLFDLVRLDGEGDDQTETIISKHATDAEGKILVENLPTGRYKLVETRPLDWYEDNKDELDFIVSPENDGEVIELEAVNQRKPLKLTTLFATTIDGLKQANPDIDNDLTDKISLEGAKEGHTYYGDTFYVNPITKKVVSQAPFEVTGNGEKVQLFTTNLLLPKGTLKDNEFLTATHVLYEDKEKTKEIGREDDLENKEQTVTFKTPKTAIKTKAHTGDGKTQTFTHGDIIKAYDNVELTHEDVLDGTKRAFKAILVAVVPGKGQQDIWDSGKIDYVVKDAKIVKQVMTDVDTSKYPEGTTFFFKEIGYNEAGEEDTRHNFGGEDRNQSLTPIKVLPQTGEDLSYMGLFVGLTMMALAVFMYKFKKEQEI